MERNCHWRHLVCPIVVLGVVYFTRLAVLICQNTCEYCGVTTDRTRAVRVQTNHNMQTYYHKRWRQTCWWRDNSNNRGHSLCKRGRVLCCCVLGTAAQGSNPFSLFPCFLSLSYQYSQEKAKKYLIIQTNKKWYKQRLGGVYRGCVLGTAAQRYTSSCLRNLLWK